MVDAEVEDALLGEDEPQHSILARLAHVQDLLVVAQHQATRVGQTTQRQRFDDLRIQINHEHATLAILDRRLTEWTTIREKE